MKSPLRLSRSTLMSVGFGFALACGAPLGAAAACVAKPQAPATLMKGDGSAGNPFQIATAQQLNQLGLVREYADKNFILMNDIDLAAAGICEFKTIPVFRGNFNGNKKAIWRLRSTVYSQSGGGLFGLLQGTEEVPAVVRNLRIENAEIVRSQANNSTSWRYSGILAGEAYNARVLGVTVTGFVSASTSAGGIFGAVTKSVLRDLEFAGRVWIMPGNTYPMSDYGGIAGAAGNVDAARVRAFGSIVGNTNTGGLFGGFSGKLTHSSASVVVSGAMATGGLVGVLMGRISNSYSRGDVEWKNPFNPASTDVRDGYVGGLVGMATNQASVVYSYSSGKVYVPSTAATKIGGFVGGHWNLVHDPNSTQTAPTFAANYFDNRVAPGLPGVGGMPKARGVLGQATTQMWMQETFRDWNFDTVWSIRERSGYPELR